MEAKVNRGFLLGEGNLFFVGYKILMYKEMRKKQKKYLKDLVNYYLYITIGLDDEEMITDTDEIIKVVQSHIDGIEGRNMTRVNELINKL